MTVSEQTPKIVQWTQRLEDAESLDGPVRAIEPTITRVFGRGARADVLRGRWLGHAVHPLLTDFVLGSWTSATVLDLTGGRASAPAAQRLIGAGLLAAGPTAWTGWSEWSAAGHRDRRVGLIHAIVNGAAIGVYLGSWLARRGGHRGAGVGLALAGATLAGGGGYLGSHLSVAKKVGSHDPAFEESSA